MEYRAERSHFCLSCFLLKAGIHTLPKIRAPKKHEIHCGMPAIFCFDCLTKSWYPYSGVFLFMYLFDDVEVTFRWFATILGDILELREWLLGTRCSKGAPRAPQSKKDEKGDPFVVLPGSQEGHFWVHFGANFSKLTFLIRFLVIFSDSKKAVKMELPKGGDMQSDNACACFVRVGRCRFGSILE